MFLVLLVFIITNFSLQLTYLLDLLDTLCLFSIELRLLRVQLGLHFFADRFVPIVFKVDLGLGFVEAGYQTLIFCNLAL